MIGNFPNLHSDELLYSVCARYSERMQYPNKQSIGEELFGTKESKAIADLPCHLDHLISNLPVGHPYTADYLIDNHTLLPFYGLFLPAGRLSLVRESMKKSNAVGIHHCAGINRDAVKRPDFLRFCPLCANEDKKKVCECYWHCVHQLPGINVCATHQIFLEESCVRLRNSGDRYSYFAAEQMIHAARPRFVDLSSNTDRVSLNLARSSLWLLERPDLGTDLESIKNKYMCILARRGLASPSDRIYAERLIEAFNNHYPPDVLSQCHSQLSAKEPWILSLLKPGRVGQSPVRHLLFINFLGLTVEEFFALETDDQAIGKTLRKLPDGRLNLPFGDGPWPCLNLTHIAGYKQLIIKQCHVTRSAKGQVVGNFSCECGFTYRRVGPDASHTDHFRYDFVRSYGPVWEDALRTLLSAPRGSAFKAARELGVTYYTARRCAARLGLLPPFPSESKVKLKNAQQEPTDLLSLYRRKLLDTIEEAGTGVSRRQIQRKIPVAYYYLSSNDSGWLEDHLLPRKVGPRKSYVNWEEVDILLAPKIKMVARQLRDAPGRPRRVSKSAIARESGHLGAIHYNLPQLPLTTAALAEVEESREDYAIRRIWWVADCYREEEVYPARWQLMNRAGLRPEVAAIPRVSSELDVAWESLHSMDRALRA